MSTPRKMIGAHVALKAPKKSGGKSHLYDFGRQFCAAFDSRFCKTRPHLASQMRSFHER